MGAIAKALRLGWIRESEARRASWSLLDETLKLRGLGGLRLIPVRGNLLALERLGLVAFSRSGNRLRARPTATGIYIPVFAPRTRRQPRRTVAR